MESTLLLLLLGAFTITTMTAALPAIPVIPDPKNTTAISSAAGPVPMPNTITSSPPLDRGPLHLSSLAPPVSSEVLRFLFNTTSAAIESSLADENSREMKCWWDSPYGCSKNWCWKTCGFPGSWCWTKRHTLNFEWARCNTWTDCSWNDECGGTCSC